MKNLLFLVALLTFISCKKDITSVASWDFELWTANNIHERGLAHFTEDDSLYMHFQGAVKSTAFKVDRNGDKITITSKDTTFGTTHFIEQVAKNKEIRWQLGDNYKEIFFTRD